MSEPILATVERLAPPSLAERRAAAADDRSLAAHATWRAAWRCLDAVEVSSGPPRAVPEGAPTIAAWNIERCFDPEGAAALVARTGAQVLLATELDRGMARSGDRDTPTALAQALGGWSIAFAVEFVELTLGSGRERALAAGRENSEGLHGNAVLSAWPIRRAAILPLDDGGGWYVGEPKNGERRVGGRNAVAAEIDAPDGAFWAVSAHFESESTPETRGTQAARLLRGLKRLAGDAPVVVGGDFNTSRFSADRIETPQRIVEIAREEPLFATLEADGFDWRSANAPGMTTRRREWVEADAPEKKLDWMFLRGARATAHWIAPALDPTGRTLSDHEMIVLQLAPGP